MQTTQDFLTKYQNYSDDELLEMHSNLSDYSDEAKEAFNIILSQRGGEESLIQLRDRKIIVGKELQRIKNAVAKLTTPEVDISFIKKMITSDILTQAHVDEVIVSFYQQRKAEQKDLEVKPETVFGSIIGGGVASLVGGVFFGLQLIYSPRIFLILLIGLGLICYGIIRIFTKKSYKNTSVLITTIMAIALSVVLGKLLYVLVGYQG